MSGKQYLTTLAVIIGLIFISANIAFAGDHYKKDASLEAYIPAGEVRKWNIDTSSDVLSDAVVTKVRVSATLYSTPSSAVLSDASARFDDDADIDGVIFFEKGELTQGGDVAHEKTYIHAFKGVSAGRKWYFAFYNNNENGKAIKVRTIAVTVYYEIPEIPDTESPTGSVLDVPVAVTQDEAFTLTLAASDDSALEKMILRVKDAKNIRRAEESWDLNAKTETKTCEISTDTNWKTGTCRIFLILIDEAGNAESIQGNNFELRAKPGYTPPDPPPIEKRFCVGYNYEQQMPLPDVTLPSVEIENGVPEINEGESVLLTATEDIDDSGEAFFYWYASKIGFEYDPDSDYRKARFVAPYVEQDEDVTITLQVGDTLGYVDTDFITITVRDIGEDDPNPPQNHAPEGPSVEGPTLAMTGVSRLFIADASDSDGDDLSFRFDWGDGDQSDWISDQSQVASASHVWDSPGSYCVKVKAKDPNGLESQWSECRQIQVISSDNQEPGKPVVSSDANTGHVSEDHTFTVTANDPDGDTLTYWFEIVPEDGEETESGWQESDSYTHAFETAGNYRVRAGVRDNIFHQAVWSDWYFITIFEEQTRGRIRIMCPDPDDEHCNAMCDRGYLSGNDLQIMWSDDDDNMDHDVTSLAFYYAVDGGGWEHIGDDTAPNSAGDAYFWKVQPDFVHEDVRIRILANYNSGATVKAVSDSFRVIDGRKPAVTISQPGSGSFRVGDPVEIRWEANCTDSYEVRRVDLSFMTSGSYHSSIARLTGDTAGLGSYSWYPDGSQITDKGQIQARVWCTNCTHSDAESTGYFEIRHQPDPESAWTEAERPFVKPDKSGWNQIIYDPDVSVDDDGNIYAVAVYSEMSKATSLPMKGRKQILYKMNADSQQIAKGYSEWESTSYTWRPHAYDVRNPKIATDSGGHAHIVYEYTPVGSDEPDIYYVCQTGAGWSDPFKLNSFSDIQYPKIIIDQQDDVYAFWREYKSGIYYRMKRSGTWSQINTAPIGQKPFDVVLDDSNVLHAVGYDGNLVYASLDSGAWSSPEVVVSDAGDQWDVGIFAINGKIHVAGGEYNESYQFHICTKETTDWKKETYAWPEIAKKDFHLQSDMGGNLHVIYIGKHEGTNKMLERVCYGTEWSDYRLISPTDVDSYHAADNNEVVSAVSWEGWYGEGASKDDVFLSYSEAAALAPKITSFKGEALSDEDPLSIKFTAEVQSSHPITKYKYVFGDGEVHTDSSPASVTHTYAQAGTYIASVVIQDANGLISTVSAEIAVSSSGYSLDNIVSSASGVIHPGELINQSVPITAYHIAPIMFKVTWPGSDLDLIITTPGGVTLTPSSDMVTDYYEGATEEYYIVDSNEQGTWNVGIKGVDVDPCGEPYEFRATVNEITDTPVGDTDRDGMPDEWEMRYFGDLSHDEAGDADGDGLSDLAEYGNNTDPTNEDTDGDAIPDGWEVAHDQNPLTDDASEDSDGDGIPNAEEYENEINSVIVTFATASQIVSEDIGAVNIPVTLSRDSYQDVIVPFSVTGTATGSGTDHNLADGIVTIPGGETFGAVTFQVMNDDLSEPDETVIVTMGTPTHALSGSVTSHTVTITQNTPFDFEAGVFIAGDSGEVGIEWLIDGGMYRGQFGIFSLWGMEAFMSDMEAFAAEAIRRVLSDSEDGYLVFSDPEEAARFSGTFGESADWNKGEYTGEKFFTMRPNDRFATILIPDSTFEEAAKNPGTTDSRKRPLFSLASSNPEHGMYLGQITDISGQGHAFVYEDILFSETSDRDYNDFIFQVSGAKGDAPLLDDWIDPAEDWRPTDLGQLVVAYVDERDEASLKTVAFSADKGGKISGEVSQTVDQGFSSTPVTAVPNPGYAFTGWAGDHTGTENPLSVTVNDDIRIIASFERIEYAVSFDAGSHGSISGEATQKRHYNEDCTEVEAVPDEGYVFVRWEGDHTGSENPLTVTDVKADMHITAVFEISRHAVTFSAETGGKITGETVQEVEHGSDCSPVTAEADVGYEFTGWSGCEHDTNPLTLSGVTADMNIVAQFTRKTYTVTFRSGENGSISGDAAQVVEHGNGTTSVTANPAEGYHFVRWSGDHTSTENPLTFGNTTKNMTITAEFGVNEYTVVFTAGDNGTLDGETTQTVRHGNDTISVTAEPADGYRFVGWTGDHIGTENPLILENVTKAYTVQAVFAELDKHGITVTSKGCCGNVEPSGTVSVTEGETPAFVITPDEHFKVVEILADSESVADIGGTYEFETVDQDHTLIVTFTHVADVNNDLRADLKDAVLLLRMLADEDSSAEMENLIWVLQVLAGMTDSSEIVAGESDVP